MHTRRGTSGVRRALPPCANLISERPRHVAANTSVNTWITLQCTTRSDTDGFFSKVPQNGKKKMNNNTRWTALFQDNLGTGMSPFWILIGAKDVY